MRRSLPYSANSGQRHLRRLIIVVAGLLLVGTLLFLVVVPRIILSRTVLSLTITQATNYLRYGYTYSIRADNGAITRQSFPAAQSVVSVNSNGIYAKTSTGAYLWSYTFSSAPINPASTLDINAKTIYPGNIVYALDDTSNVIYAFHASDGKLIWQSKLTTSNTAPAFPQIFQVSDGFLYIGGASITNDPNLPIPLYVLRATDGSLVWHFEAPGLDTHAMKIADGAVYVGSANGAYALRASDGTRLWMHPGESFTHSPTVVDDGVAYFLNDTSINALSTKNGAPIWHIQCDYCLLPSNIGVPTILPIENGVLYVLNGVADPYASKNDSIEALGAKDGILHWQHQCLSYCDTANIISGNMYLPETCYPPSCSKSGFFIEALNITDGTLRWHQALAESPGMQLLGTTNGLLGANGMLFTIGDDGVVEGLSAHTGKTLWHTNLHFGEGEHAKATLLSS